MSDTMRRLRRMTLLGGMMGWPVMVVAQPSITDSRIDAPLRTALTPILDSAQSRGLPTDPLIDKALEGVSKHAPSDRIVAVVHNLLGDLFTARNALGSAASTSELVAGASAIKAGIQPNALTQIAMAMHHDQERSLVVSLAVLSQLVARGVPADTAASTVLTLAQRGAQDEALVAFREDVEREIAAGVLPGVAAVEEVPPTGVFAASSLSNLPGRHPPPAKSPQH